MIQGGERQLGSALANFLLPQRTYPASEVSQLAGPGRLTLECHARPIGPEGPSSQVALKLNQPSRDMYISAGS